MSTLFDFDGTLVPERNNLYWHLVHELPDPRWRAAKAVAFAQAMGGLIPGAVAGLVSHDQMYKLMLLATFSGLPVDMVAEATEALGERIEALVFEEMSEVLGAAAEPRFLVTSNTAEVVGGFCGRVGMECVATRLHTAGGRYTGLVDGELNKGPEKVARLRALGVELRSATAYGNTGDDEAMLHAAGEAVLVNPKGALASRHRLRGARTMTTARR